MIRDNGFNSNSKILTVGIYVFIILMPFIVFYWQIPFMSDMTIGNDYIAFPITQQMELHYSLAHGTFPLYAPGFAGGQAVAALTLGQLFHPLPYIAATMPGYWHGNALEWNTLFRLVSLGVLHLALFIFLLQLGLNGVKSFLISFITVYNLRMLDLFHYGASLENYTAFLFLCLALAFYYLKPSRFWGPFAIIISTYLLVCGGHPQMMYLGLLGAAIACLFLPFVLDGITGEKHLIHRNVLAYFSKSAVWVIGGVLLASVYTIPFYTDFILTNAQRVGQDYHFSLQYSSSVTGMLNSFFAPLQSEVQGAFGSSTVIILVMVIPFLYFFKVRVPVAITALWGVLLVIFLAGTGNATPLHYYFWKYFPLAQSFRIPGRLSMLFPFLFLLILAWLFRPGKDRQSDKRFPVFLWAGLLAVVVYLGYHWVITHFVHLPKLKFCIPEQIKPYPVWVEPLLFWLGLLVLVLVVFYAFLAHRRLEPSNGIKHAFLHYIIGMVLVGAVVVQVTVAFRYGTWVVERTNQATLNQMDKQKKQDLNFRGDPGHGMETALVFNQKRFSILDPFLAKFYRNYIIVPNQKKAYSFLRKQNATRTVAVEVPSNKTFTPGNQDCGGSFDLNRVDRVVLKHNTFNRLVFQVEAQAPGFFTLAFPWEKGWTATVNGKHVDIYRGNGYLQALLLNAGVWEIQFRYWSKAAFLGVIVSGLVFLVICCYFAFFVFSGKKRWITVLVAVLIPGAVFLCWKSSIYTGDNLDTRYTWTSSQFPPANDLAYAKKTTMSSLEWLYYSGLAVDGKIGPGFKTDRLEKAWWQVDLGISQPIGEIVIYDGPFTGKKHLPLDITGSLDGKAFKLLKRVSERGEKKPWRIPLQGEVTRFVKLDAPSNRILSFKEVEIFPPAGGSGKENESSLTALLKGRDYVEISPRKLVDMVMNQSPNSSGASEITIWNPKGQNVAEISPQLVTFGKWGKYKINARREGEDGVLEISVAEPDKNGVRRLHFGFEEGRNGLDLEDVEGKFVTFIVQAAFPIFQSTRENYIAIVDFNSNGSRNAGKSYISTPQWRTYVSSLKVRPGCKRLLFMIRFNGKSESDRLKIKNAYIVVSKEALKCREMD